jgi:hypothetical protein
MVLGSLLVQEKPQSTFAEFWGSCTICLPDVKVARKIATNEAHDQAVILCHLTRQNATVDTTSRSAVSREVKST